MKKTAVSMSAAFALSALSQGANAQFVPLSALQDNFEDDDVNAVLINNEIAQENDWVVGANVWDEFYFGWLYNYFAFPAPNNNTISGTGVDAFSAITLGEGGPEQGDQVLAVYSDYNNGDHLLGFYIEANVYHDFRVHAANIGETWTFSWDAKAGGMAGNPDPLSDAVGFIKTINPPDNGGNWDLTNFVTVDQKNISPDWMRYDVSLEITPDLEGQLFQIGWFTVATNYDPSSVFVDNVDLSNGSNPCPADLNGDGILDNGDIATFIPLFIAQDLAVDFNGDGFIDNGDIADFLVLFLAGC